MECIKKLVRGGLNEGKRSWVEPSAFKGGDHGYKVRMAATYPQRSILRPIWFSVFAKGLDEGNECALCKFSDDVKTGKQSICRLEKWAKVNLMKLNKVKHQALPWRGITLCTGQAEA